MITKSIDSLTLSLDEALDKYDEILKGLLVEAKILLKDRWVFMSNKSVFYDNEVVALYPKLDEYTNYFSLSRAGAEIQEIKEVFKSSFEFEELEWNIPSLGEVQISFNNEVEFPFNRLGSSNKIAWINMYDDYFSSIAYLDNNNYIRRYYIETKGISLSDANNRVIVPIFRLNAIDSDRIDDIKVFELWLKNNLIPKDTEYELDYKILIKLAQKYQFIVTDYQIKLDRESIKKDYIENKFDIKLEIGLNDYVENLLICDEIRADIEKYDEKILLDPNRGHWEIWNNDDENKIKIKLEKELIARNPAYDIKHGGIVGIDFGTKSTVVVHQENSEHTLPMRVGIGQFRKAIDEKHYENPTVMHFVNLETFLETYKKPQGRPFTKWNDLNISHTAFNSLLNSKSDEYYSYFSELKQWCGNREKRIRIQDKNKEVYDLPTFLEISDNDLNPVELYAYYLGLYINNMHNGIYMEYTLSFPVTYEKEVRDKIIESFARGLKKSLPEALIKDEEIMKNFKVYQGTSEPAAYAISALQEYGFEPENDSKVFYGVFDFGGGTTDFDFGIWRESSGIREKRYDYVIEHFGAGGDRYLGGENLLELLAFEVFKENSNDLREKGITFILPPECKKFPGSEVLLNESQEAKLNTRQLMEKLRPLWEKHENYEKIFEKGSINVNLYNNLGTQTPNFELKIDIEKLNSVLKDRIEKGVKNFFESIRMTFYSGKADGISKVNIFLAGNSSKSPILKEIFEDYIEKETQNVLSLVENSREENSQEQIFEIYPPLGTEDAYIKQEQLGLVVERDNLIRPTGKTGVAFGLIESRNGAKIKVENKNFKEDEAKFQFYVGENRKKKFNPILEAGVDYGRWYEFIDASEEDFEIYYTTLPKASTKQLLISETSRMKCRIEEIYEDEKIGVYIRAVEPTKIEYVVAGQDGIEKGEFLSEIKSIQLNG